MKVKICGLTKAEHVEECIKHGSDYCGTSKRDLDHDYLSYKFCDKFKIWGHSKFFKKNARF